MAYNIEDNCILKSDQHLHWPMASSSAQPNGNQFRIEKSIPEHIIDGSIVIDSVEAFGSILKQFPDDPALLKAYSDLLLKNNLLDLAAKFYGEAAELFIENGRMLQAIISKKLQWRINPAGKRAVGLFVKSMRNGNFADLPLKRFVDRLSPGEMVALFGRFVRTRLPAGKIVKKRGDSQDSLYFIVSGTLKDSVFPSLEKKEKIHRPSVLYLSEDQFFGGIYPFDEKKLSESDIETVTRVELAKISKASMRQLCRKYPNIELALIELFKVRVDSGHADDSTLLRKSGRYPIPVAMRLEIYLRPSHERPVIVNGFSSDISIGGICVILDGNSKNMASILKAFQKNADGSRVWIGLQSETMQVKVLGKIAWNHKLVSDGKMTLALGIQFDEMSPRLRGVLFMFANSLQKTS